MERKMFIVLLYFSDNKAQAKEHMEGHNAWIKKGFNDDVFLLVGSIEPNSGGSILAYNSTPDELRSRVDDDPFIANNIVKAEIIEISPKKSDERLSFLVKQ